MSFAGRHACACGLEKRRAGAARRAACSLFAVFALAASAIAAAGAGKADLNVVVTVKPIHSLVTALMEGIGTPTLLVDGAASPHNFALKPSAVRAVHAADVLVRVSESLEPFTAKVVRALPEGVQVVTLSEAPGVKLLKRRTSGAFEAHGHAAASGVAVTESAHTEPRDDRGGVDGHIWLDPDNAKAIMSALAKVLGARAPGGASRIEENARRLNARIDALAAGIEAELAPLKDKPFVVFHDAYQYFERRFGLDAVGSITVSPDVQPSAKRLTELRRKIKSLGAVCVFAEPLFQPNLVAAVTEGTDARPGTLDPEGRMLEPGANLYFKLMGNLAAELKACLGAAS